MSSYVTKTRRSSSKLLLPPFSPSSSSSHVQTLIPHNNNSSNNTAMARKSLFKQTLLAMILLVLATYGFFNAFLYPLNPSSSKLDSDFPSVSSVSSSYRFNLLSTGGGNVVVKVFMYDLPRQFTYGVIENYALARGGVPDKDDKVMKYPGNQHSAEWYLFSDMIKESKDRDQSAVVRVLDPEDADLFYVPFFSSLSLVVNPIRGGDGSTSVYSDEETQESLIEWLSRQGYWKRNNGWDHVFICQDPNALYKVIENIRNGVLLLSDFGRLKKDQASFVKDVILPYSHRIKTYSGDLDVENRKSLLFFMGNRYRKEGGKIRDLLFQVLEKEEDVIIKHGAQSRESRRMASQGMHSSKFCLHPAGDTPSACRLFDAIVSLCVPVIVSDQIELPFEDVIDYKKIAVFVNSISAVQPGFLVKKLRAFTEERILEYQQELNKVKRYFEYEESNGTVNEIWRQVSQKLPLIKLMINRDKRLVKRGLTEPDCSCICSNKTGPVITL